MFRALICLAVLVGLSCALPGASPLPSASVPDQPAVAVPNVTVPSVPNVSGPGSADSIGVVGLIKVILGLLHGLLSMLTNEVLKPVEDIIPAQLVGKVPSPSKLLKAITSLLPTGALAIPGATPLSSIIDGVVAGLYLVLIAVLKLVIALLTVVLSILQGTLLPAIAGIIPDILAGLPPSSLSLNSLLQPILQTVNVGGVLNTLSSFLGNPLGDIVPAI
uniref:Uncharacterized protein n=1 Tax=Ditylenchus dipsaci TaxID=166011 RepID=A0A915D929_9BILA